MFGGAHAPILRTSIWEIMEMSDAKVRGVVHLIEDEKTYGQRGFRKRLVVLEQDGERFTNYIPLEFTHEGCDTVNDLKVGDEVEISYRLSGRKWQKDPSSEVKFFLNAEATGFQVVKDKAPADKAPAGEAPAGEASVNDQLAEAQHDDEDIPF